jgi:hypothetical protein
MTMTTTDFTRLVEESDDSTLTELFFSEDLTDDEWVLVAEEFARRNLATVDLTEVVSEP